MIRTLTLNPGTTCANTRCPNKLGEGSFVLVNLGDEDKIVGGHRGFDLLLCFPCYIAFRENAKGPAASFSIDYPPPTITKPGNCKRHPGCQCERCRP